MVCVQPVLALPCQWPLASAPGFQGGSPLKAPLIIGAQNSCQAGPDYFRLSPCPDRLGRLSFLLCRPNWQGLITAKTLPGGQSHVQLFSQTYQFLVNRAWPITRTIFGTDLMLENAVSAVILEASIDIVVIICILALPRLQV
jgi:hypothetical protein